MKHWNTAFIYSNKAELAAADAEEHLALLNISFLI